MKIKPILFNTEMVKALQDGRKTATRRCVKPQSKKACGFSVTFRESDNAFMGVYDYDENGRKFDNPQTPPSQPGDILYVRETWAFMPCIGCNGDYARPGSGMNCYDTQTVEYDDGEGISDGCFIYRADCKKPERIIWRPSIHMPKQAARIWLKVTDVRVERLQDMTEADAKKEGFEDDIEYALGHPAVYHFAELWDRTVNRNDIGIYGWKANPWVWVIEFEQCEKPEVD